MKKVGFPPLIPVPQHCEMRDGQLPLIQLTTFSAAAEFAVPAGELPEVFAHLGLQTVPAAKDGVLQIVKKAGIVSGGWELEITSAGITLSAGDVSGCRYGLGALVQLLFAAAVKGLPGDALEAMYISDVPRFEWRGFHLDSARHFQSAEFIKKFLKILAAFRINRFHWHLTDGQGWRLPVTALPELDGRGRWSDGQYTVEEIAGINRCAAELGITIVPEVDVPGHSSFLLEKYPQYGCRGAENCREICLGKVESMTLLKQIFSTVMELFPDSPYIHIGGDEANTANWENCPDCRRAMQENGLENMRQLENRFMAELADFIIRSGCTPIIWGTCSGQTYPPETVIQCWLDIREPLRVIPNGNKVVYSVHTSLYFDYPARLSEPWENWMFHLSESGVYMTDPHIIWPDKVSDGTLGTEACLWTETVPQHRVLSKLFPRIWAYSECAWSDAGNKDWDDFCRRKEILESSGYFDFIRR